MGAEVLYEKTREYVGETKGKVVFDLYSGTGTIAPDPRTGGGESSPAWRLSGSSRGSRENAARNGLGNCEFLAGDVLKVVDELEEKPDLIVLDPPRDGIHPKAIGKILNIGVSHMVYVSCKPTSLARDLEPIQAAGYQVDKVCCVDMFPHTGQL